MLTLPIKKQWFDMILSGEKTEEYRDSTGYWRTRFYNLFGYPAYWGEPKKVLLRNGYRKDSPYAVATVTLETGLGKLEWGAVPGKHYFILNIQSVEVEGGGEDG